MPPAQLCFIVSEPTTLSKADNQRRRMKALSHAAIVSYTRRNPANKGWIQVATAPSFAPSAQSRKNCQLPSRDKRNGSNNGSPEFTKGEQHSQQAQSKRDDLCSHGWLDTAVCEELDPFLKTAFALSRRERSLLHQCEMPQCKLLLGPADFDRRPLHSPCLRLRHPIRVSFLHCERLERAPDPAQPTLVTVDVVVRGDTSSPGR